MLIYISMLCLLSSQHHHQSSSSATFSHEWACRKVVITENNACFVPTSSPAWRGSTRYVLNLFAEHCARTNNSMELCDITTRWHCFFCDQGDRSKGREKDQEFIVSRTLGFDDILFDKYVERHLSLNYIHAFFWCSLPHMMYQLIPICKKCLPEIFHNTGNLKRGVIRRVLA